MNINKKCIMFLIIFIGILSSTLMAQEEVREDEGTTVIKGSKSKKRIFMKVDGKRFFMIGAYSDYADTKIKYPNAKPYKILCESGVNAVLATPWRRSGKDLVLHPKNVLDMDYAAQHYNLKFIMQTEPYWALRKEEKIGVALESKYYYDNRKRLLEQRIKMIKAFPERVKNNIIAFYNFDEPENVLAKGWKMFRKNGIGLQDWIFKATSWEYKLLKENFPKVYIAGVIAWRPSYPTLNVTGFCDINLPDVYPTCPIKGSPKEFVTTTKEKKNYTFESVVVDARSAVDAALSNGKPMPTYMPYGCCNDNCFGRQMTRDETMYCYFGPISVGCMGIWPWASYRCKIDYAEQIIIPITRALKQLSPFLTGKWLDKKIISYSPSGSSTKLTKKYKLPDVTCCLREAPDGRWMLIAVNNTPKTVKTSFKLGVDFNRAREYFSGLKMDIVKGRIKDTMPRYGVKVYILEDF